MAEPLSILVVVSRDCRGRRDGHGPADERRRTDRRRGIGAHAELLARGFLLARRDPHAGAPNWGTLR